VLSHYFKAKHSSSGINCLPNWERHVTLPRLTVLDMLVVIMFKVAQQKPANPEDIRSQPERGCATLSTIGSEAQSHWCWPFITIFWFYGEKRRKGQWNSTWNCTSRGVGVRPEGTPDSWVWVRKVRLRRSWPLFLYSLKAHRWMIRI
jgi:hypothetical protein